MWCVGAPVTNLEHKDESHVLGIERAWVPEDPLEEGPNIIPGLPDSIQSFTGEENEPLLI